MSDLTHLSFGGLAAPQAASHVALDNTYSMQWQRYSAEVAAKHHGFGAMSIVQQLAFFNEDAAMWNTLYACALTTPGAVIQLMTVPNDPANGSNGPAILMWAPERSWT